MNRFFTLSLVLSLSHGLGLAQQLPDLVAEHGYADRVLEPGRYADFVALEKDFFTIPVEDIPEMQVIMTGLSDQIVYDRDQLAGGN